MEFLEHLASEVEQTGHSVVRGEHSFRIDALGLTIEAETGERKEHNVDGRQTVTIQLTIKATHADLFPNGILECIGALGKDDIDAFEYGALVWIHGVFAPIHECLAPVPTQAYEVQGLSMVSRNEDTDEHLGWTAYLGPIQKVGDFAEEEDIQSDYLFLALYNELVAHLSASRFLWIKIYVARFPDDQVIADVWLNNSDWPEALTRIQDLIAARQKVTTFSAFRQFIVIRPRDISELKNADTLIAALPPKPKRGFLDRLFGRS